MELVSHATDITSVSPATADTDMGSGRCFQSELWITSSENMSLYVLIFVSIDSQFLFKEKVKALNTIVLFALSPISDQSYSYPRSIGRVFVLNDVFTNLTGELLYGPTVLFWPPFRNMSFATNYAVLFLFSSSGMNKDM